MDGCKKILVPGFDDAQYLHKVALIKRAVELYALDRDFHDAFDAAPEKTLAAYGMAEVDSVSAKLLLGKKNFEAAQSLEEFPQTFRRYVNFVLEKLTWRIKMREEDCRPENVAWRAWRRRQMMRCKFEFGADGDNIIHTPIAYELTKGCSVGCKFCGFGAESLTKIFHYTAENAALWKKILRAVQEIIGAAGGSGMLYYSSEPFDNPDYEKFLEDFFAVFKKVPRITTAAATRNIERTRRILKRGYELEPHVDRFSVLNRKMLDKIFKSFTLEELVAVELLPQFADAPENFFVAAGRAYEKISSPDENGLGDTIACLSGIIINMAEKKFTLATPCRADKNHPLGQKFYATKIFKDADEFREGLYEMIQAHMPVEPDFDAEMKLHGFIHLTVENNLLTISGNDYELKKNYPENLAESMHAVVEVLQKTRGGSIRGLAKKFSLERELDPAYTSYVMKHLWRLGIFED